MYHPRVSTEIAHHNNVNNDMVEKQSSQSLYGRNDYTNDYESSRYEHSIGYSEDDQPMSTEERALVRKIDFFVMPIICTINLLQVQLKKRQKFLVVKGSILYHQDTREKSFTHTHNFFFDTFQTITIAI